VRRLARRLAAEARDDALDESVDVLAQVRPRRRRPGVRRATATPPYPVSNACAWCEGYSLHAEVVIEPAGALAPWRRSTGPVAPRLPQDSSPAQDAGGGSHARGGDGGFYSGDPPTQLGQELLWVTELGERRQRERVVPIRSAGGCSRAGAKR